MFNLKKQDAEPPRQATAEPSKPSNKAEPPRQATAEPSKTSKKSRATKIEPAPSGTNTNTQSGSSSSRGYFLIYFILFCPYIRISATKQAQHQFTLHTPKSSTTAKHINFFTHPLADNCMHRHRHYFDWSKHKKGAKSSGRSYKGATRDKYKEQGSYYCCFTILLQEHRNINNLSSIIILLQ